MTPDIEALLSPISGEDPCGPDLLYDLERQDLERVFDTDVSIDTSGQAGERPNVDWPQIIDRMLDQFARSKDLWLATALCRAGAAGGRLEIVDLGADLLVGLFERYWDGVHPRLDEVGLTGRRTVCDPLSHKGAFLDLLSRVPLFVHPRLGGFAGQDLSRLRKEMEADPSYGLFRQALQELGDSQLQSASEALGRIAASLKRAERVFAEKGGSEVQLDFDPAYQAISELRKSIAAFSVNPIAEEPAMDGENPVVERPKAVFSGMIDSREDVIRAIDAISDYYRRREPSSPVLPLVVRAKTWVPMSFLDVLEDIAPETVEPAKRVLLNKPSS